MKLAIILLVFAFLIQLIQCSNKVHPIALQEATITEDFVAFFMNRYKFTNRAEVKCIQDWFEEWPLNEIATNSDIDSFCFFCLSNIRDIIMDRFNQHVSRSSSIYWQRPTDHVFRLTQQEADDLYWPKLVEQRFKSKLSVPDAALFILALRDCNLDGVERMLMQSPGELGIDGIRKLVKAMECLNINRAHEIVFFLNLATDWMKAYAGLEQTCTTNSMVLNQVLNHLAPIHHRTTPIYYTTCNHLVSLWEHYYAIYIWDYLKTLLHQRTQMKIDRSLAQYIRLGVIIKKLIVMYNLQGVTCYSYSERNHQSKDCKLTKIRTRIIMSLWLRKAGKDFEPSTNLWSPPIDYNPICEEYHMTVQLYQICCTMRDHVLSCVNDRLHSTENAHHYPRSHPLRSLYDIVNKRAFWAVFVTQEGIDFVDRWKKEYSTSRFPITASLTVESLQHLATSSNARHLPSNSTVHSRDQKLLDRLDNMHIGHQTTSALNVIHYFMMQIDRTRQTLVALNPDRRFQSHYNELLISFKRLSREWRSMTNADLQTFVPYLHIKWFGCIPLQWEAVLNVLYRAIKLYHWSLPDRLEYIGVDRSMCIPISDAIYALNCADRQSSLVTLGLLIQALVVIEAAWNPSDLSAPLGRVPTELIMDIVKRSLTDQSHVTQFTDYMAVRCPSDFTEIAVFLEVMLALGQFNRQRDQSVTDIIWRNVYQGVVVGMARTVGMHKVVIAVMERLHYKVKFVNKCRSALGNHNPTVEEFVSFMNQMIEPNALTSQKATDEAASSTDHL